MSHNSAASLSIGELCSGSKGCDDKLIWASDQRLKEQTQTSNLKADSVGHRKLIRLVCEFLSGL